MTFSCIFLHEQGYNPTLSREKTPSQALTTTKHPPSLTAQGCALLVRLGDWREDGKDSPALFLSRTYNEVHRRPDASPPLGITPYTPWQNGPLHVISAKGIRPDNVLIRHDSEWHYPTIKPVLWHFFI